MLVKLAIFGIVAVVVLITIAFVVYQLTKNTQLQLQQRNVKYLVKKYEKHVRLTGKYSKRGNVALAVLHLNEAQKYEKLLEKAIPGIVEEAAITDL